MKLMNGMRFNLTGQARPLRGCDLVLAYSHFVRRIRLLGIFSILASLVVGCSATPIEMPNPKVSIYLLDLTGSGNAIEQLGRIQDDLIISMTRETLGNPFPGIGEVYGPTITRMYFVGTNSFALQDFKLQNFEIPYQLLEQIKNSYKNEKNRQDVWDTLRLEYSRYVKDVLAKATAPTKQSCLIEFDDRLAEVWSNEEVRREYSSPICDLAVYSLSNYFNMTRYVTEQSAPKAQKASDVFGAFSKIANIANKYHEQFPDTKVNVFLATDGDHRLGADSPDNLKPKLLEAKNPCDLAEEIRTKYGLQEFKPSSWLSIEARGIAALKDAQGEYPQRLNDFYQRCFLSEL
jgi:hypothetical protein